MDDQSGPPALNAVNRKGELMNTTLASPSAVTQCKRRMIAFAASLTFIMQTITADAQNPYAGMTTQQKEATIALEKKARDRYVNGTLVVGSTKAEEALGYQYYYGTNGAKENCDEADTWFSMASNGIHGNSVMGSYYVARIDALGCPLHHYRHPDLAKRIWTGMLFRRDVNLEFKKIIEKDLKDLEANTDPVAPRLGMKEDGTPEYRTDADTEKQRYGAAMLLLGLFAGAAGSASGSSSSTPSNEGAFRNWVCTYHEETHSISTTTAATSTTTVQTCGWQ
jgi:hypothetical protein